MARARNHRGLTLLEFTLLIVIFSVLIVFFVERIIALRAQIERVAVERTIGALQSRLSLEFAELVVNDKTQRIREWAGGNALRLLDEDQRGAVTDTDRMTPGEWRYDAQAGEIVYRPQYPELLAGDADAEGRWRVVVSGAEQPTGLRLTTVEPLVTAQDSKRGD